MITVGMPVEGVITMRGSDHLFYGTVARVSETEIDVAWEKHTDGYKYNSDTGMMHPATREFPHEGVSTYPIGYFGTSYVRPVEERLPYAPGTSDHEEADLDAANEEIARLQEQIDLLIQGRAATESTESVAPTKPTVKRRKTK